MGKELKIGTLNLNGEMWQIFNNSRIPLSWKETIQGKLTEGLSKLLEDGHYDIIAVQELVYNQVDLYESLKTKIEDKGYKLIKPENLGVSGDNTHFTVAFIVKEGYEIVDEPHNDITVLISKYECNRIMARNFIINNVKFTIVNVHITGRKLKIKKNLNKYMYDILKEMEEKEITKEKKVILVGDFNACTKDQDEHEKAASQKYINLFSKKNDKCKKYKECGKDTNHTYYHYRTEAPSWRKLDHIFISNSMKGYEEKEEKDDSVNYNKYEETGFTDHSMLTLYLKV